MNRPLSEEAGLVLSMVRMCQNLNVLPLPGGLLDQDAYFVYLLECVLVADNKRSELDKARQATKVG